MIQKISHATICATDQVFAKGEPDLEIILTKTGSSENFVAMKGGASGPFAPRDLESMNCLLNKGMLSPGAFRTADCRKTVADLKAKGVEFLSEPKDQFYGIEAIFRDPFGNWFSLSQPKNN
jgi:hypothetical protein